MHRPTITVILEEMKLPNDEMTSDWYNGRLMFHTLIIDSDWLDAIHRDAFNATAFQYLTCMEMYISKGSVVVYSGALDGLSHLTVFMFAAEMVRSFPNGLFDAFATDVQHISIDPWPNNINLNKMFRENVYRHLTILYVSNAEWPKSQFRVLAAANFSSFRMLQNLTLANCGIEVIMPRTFDAIAHSLEHISLNSNYIKFVNVEMFRKIFESHRWPEFDISDNTPQCSCDLVELETMHRPFADMPYIDCDPDDDFEDTACGVFREFEFDTFCIRDQPDQLRIIEIQMAYVNKTMVFRTNFSSHYRVLAINLDAMRTGDDCSKRSFKMNFNCFVIDRRVDRMTLRDMDRMGDAQLVSITVIPILHQFGTRPLHSMTLRRELPRVDDTDDDISSWTVGAIATIVGGLIGFAGGILGMQMMNQTEKSPPERQSSIEEFVEESEFDEPIEYEYCNHIELSDLGIGLGAFGSAVDYDSEYYYQEERRREAQENEYM